MSNHAVMSHGRFASLMAGVATRSNRGRPGRRGKPSKRVVAPKPADEAIATLLFYKETYTPAGEKQEAYTTDTKVRAFMKQYGLTTFAPIEDTPSFRRVRVKKTANFALDTLQTFRIEGNEDVLVVTGRLLTKEEIAALGPKAVALAPRKRTLQAAGVRITPPASAPTPGAEIKEVTAVTKLREQLARREAVLADEAKRNAALNVAEVNAAVKYFREVQNTPKTADQINRMSPGDVRRLLLSDTKSRLKAAEVRAANIQTVAGAPTTPPPSATSRTADETRRAAQQTPDVPTPEDIQRFLDVWNGDARAGETPLPTNTDPAGKTFTKAEVKKRFGDAPRAKLLAVIETAVEARAQIRAMEEEALRAREAAPRKSGLPPLRTPPPAPAPELSPEDIAEEEAAAMREAAGAPPPPPRAPGAPRGAKGTALSQKEIDELARLSNKTAAGVVEALKGQPREIAMQILEGVRRKAAAQQPAAPTTASVVPEAPSIPPFAVRVVRKTGGSDVPDLWRREVFAIEDIDAEGKATPAVTNYLKGIFKDLGVTSRDEQNVAANVILARALSAQDARNRADAFAEIYEQVKAQAGAKSLAAFATDENRLRELDSQLRSMVGPGGYVPPYETTGYPVGPRSGRGATRSESEEGSQPPRAGDETEVAGAAARRGGGIRERRNPRLTLRKPRGSNRFTKVREAQEKQERLAASLPAVRRDLGIVRRRLTMLKGKRTAQAKYARDQLQAEATRLMRRIEKIEGQVERAAAAVARAVKAANPKKKQPKVKPLKQPKAKKPKATRKRPTTAKRRR